MVDFNAPVPGENPITKDKIQGKEEKKRDSLPIEGVAKKIAAPTPSTARPFTARFGAATKEAEKTRQIAGRKLASPESKASSYILRKSDEINPKKLAQFIENHRKTLKSETIKQLEAAMKRAVNYQSKMLQTMPADSWELDIEEDLDNLESVADQHLDKAELKKMKEAIKIVREVGYFKTHGLDSSNIDRLKTLLDKHGKQLSTPFQKEMFHRASIYFQADKLLDKTFKPSEALSDYEKIQRFIDEHPTTLSSNMKYRLSEKISSPTSLDLLATRYFKDRDTVALSKLLSEQKHKIPPNEERKLVNQIRKLLDEEIEALAESVLDQIDAAEWEELDELKSVVEELGTSSQKSALNEQVQTLHDRREKAEDYLKRPINQIDLAEMRQFLEKEGDRLGRRYVLQALDRINTYHRVEEEGNSMLSLKDEVFKFSEEDVKKFIEDNQEILSRDLAGRLEQRLKGKTAAPPPSEKSAEQLEREQQAQKYIEANPTNAVAVNRLKRNIRYLLNNHKKELSGEVVTALERKEKDLKKS